MKEECSGYRLADHISWVVEQQGILLIDRRTNRHTWLSYPEAAIWDLVARKIPEKRLLRMLAVISATNEREAAKLLQRCLEKLHKDNWLLREAAS